MENVMIVAEATAIIMDDVVMNMSALFSQSHELYSIPFALIGSDEPTENDSTSRAVVTMAIV